MDVWEVNAGWDVWLDDAVVIMTIAPVFDSIRGADRFGGWKGFEAAFCMMATVIATSTPHFK
jgi:hypothetical protein